MADHLQGDAGLPAVAGDSDFHLGFCRRLDSGFDRERTYGFVISHRAADRARSEIDFPDVAVFHDRFGVHPAVLAEVDVARGPSVSRADAIELLGPEAGRPVHLLIERIA